MFPRPFLAPAPSFPLLCPSWPSCLPCSTAISVHHSIKCPVLCEGILEGESYSVLGFVRASSRVIWRKVHTTDSRRHSKQEAGSWRDKVRLLISAPCSSVVLDEGIWRLPRQLQTSLECLCLGLHPWLCFSV